MNNNGKNIALYAFERFGDNVLRLAFSRTGNMPEAEDIAQEVFLKLHTSDAEFVSDEHIKAWLLRVTVNLCINYHKSFRIRGRTALDDNVICGLTAETNSRDIELIEAISALPAKYSTVIHLYYYEGYAVNEIAQILGKKENTVYSLLRRAREKLKITLEEDDGYEKQPLQGNI